jgi:RNA recognition motif-containing protein
MALRYRRRGLHSCADEPIFSEYESAMTKIYVGNLPFSANESEVRDLFGQHGTVESVSLIMDRETGRPRGFGFVEMSRADATRAIESLNGKEMGGRALRVNEAQERTGGGGPPRGAGPKRW